LPLGPVIQSTNDLPAGPLELQVYPGQDARFVMVEDDGATMAYQRGDVRQTTFVWNDAARRLTWTIAGTYAGKDVYTALRVKLFDAAGSKDAAAELGGGGTLSLGP